MFEVFNLDLIDDHELRRPRAKRSSTITHRPDGVRRVLGTALISLGARLDPEAAQHRRLATGDCG